MNTFYARILPRHLRVKPNDGQVVPLIVEHDVYGKSIGSVTLYGHYAHITSDDIGVGDTLSAGAFLVEGDLHDVREVSLTKNPKFPECVVIKEIGDDKSINL